MTCAAAALGIFSCSHDPSQDLAPQYSAEQRIEGVNPSQVVLHLSPGAYLVEARERDIDVRLVVDAPNLHSEIEDRIPRHGLHARVVSLAEPGDLRVELRSTEHRGKRGVVQLRVARWRRGTDGAPGAREQGYGAFGSAGEQTTLGTKESWTRAADLLHESIAQFATAGDDESRAQAEYTLAHLEYQARMEWQAAIRAAESAGEIYRGLDDLAGMHNSAVLRASAELEVASGMSAGAQRAAQRALYTAADKSLALAAEHFTAHNLTMRAQYAINMRGIRAYYEGAYEEAAGFFEKTVDLARANADPGEEASALANLAWMHNRLGLVTRAASEYERLLPLIERDRQPDVYGNALGNYGLCLVALGDFDRAVALHTEALQLYVRLNNDAEHARQLAALGGLYFRTGDMTRALETLRAAMPIQERVGAGIARASALRIAGNAASALGQHDLALQYLRKSVEIDVNPHNVARTRALIAAELRVLGDLRGADSELTRAAESDNSLARASLLGERGRLRIVQNRYAEAIDDLRAADRQLVELGLDFNRIETNTALSQALLAVHDIPGAAAAADTAVSIVGTIRVKSANPEWRAHFLSSRYSPYEARIAAHFAAGDDPQTSWRAFRTAEEVRARSLTDRLVGSAPRAGATPDVEGDALRARLTSLQLRLESRLQRLDNDETEVLELRRAIVEARAQIDAHRARSERVAASEVNLAESLGELQRRLPADTAVLAYFVGDAATHAWLLTRDRLRHAKLRGRASMQRLAAGFVGARRLAGPRTGDGDAARELLGNLFDGATENRLLIVADGPLNGVPFAALPLPGDSTKLLLDRFVIGYSASLGLALDGTPRKGAQSTRVVVISDPVYAADDQRLTLADRGGGHLRGPRPVSPHNLTRLPYSALEARTVAKVLGTKDTIQLEGFDANLGRVLDLARENLAILHFATHAVARRDLPEQSALYLTEYSREGALLDDSRLTASEITRSGLRADVVVLSGCATGDGSELRGEGVLGLTYGFLGNGSRSVVAALWPIEDASTARFMNEFYRAYRDLGNTAEALRTAQLQARAAGKTAAWSSFVVRANGFP